MKKALGTNEVVEDLIIAFCGDNATIREKHLVRQSLHALVRLAKSEHMAEMKTSVRKLTGNIGTPTARRRAKAALLAYRLAAISSPKQQYFEFYQG